MSNTENDTPEIKEENKRRDFIKNSALAAGAIAAVGVSTQASAQKYAISGFETAKLPEFEKPKLLTAAFDKRYQEKITREDVFRVVDLILDIGGCPACGLNGFDINLSVNPIFKIDTNIPVNVSLNHQ